MKITIKSKILSVALIATVLIISGAILFFSNRFKADTTGGSCFSGAYYKKGAYTGKYMGIGGTVKLGTFTPDQNRYSIFKYNSGTFCKSNDNPSLYMGIKEIGGMEVDAGLSWEVSKDSKGNLSFTQNSFRPFWRAPSWGAAPAIPEYTWHQGDTVRMEMTVPEDNTLNLVIEGANKKFEKRLTVSGLKHNSIHETKIVNSIDQAYNERNPVQPTNAKIIGNVWSERYAIDVSNNKLIPRPEVVLKCNSGNITISDSVEIRAAETVSISGDKNTGSNRSSCDPGNTASGASTDLQVTLSKQNPESGEIIDLTAIPKLPRPEAGNENQTYDLLIEEVRSENEGEVRTALKSVSLDPARNYSSDQPVITEVLIPEKVTPGDYTISSRIVANGGSTILDKQSDLDVVASNFHVEASSSDPEAGDIIEIRALADLPRIQFGDNTQYQLVLEKTDMSNNTSDVLKSADIDTSKTYQISQPIVTSNWTVPAKSTPTKYEFTAKVVKKAAPTKAVLAKQTVVTAKAATTTPPDTTPPDTTPPDTTPPPPVTTPTTPTSGGDVTVGVCVPTQNADGSFTCKDKFNWASYVEAIYGYAIILGGTLSVLMLVYAGYIYLTCQGDTTKIGQAKEVFFGAILGLLILFTVRLILDFIGLPN